MRFITACAVLLAAVLTLSCAGSAQQDESRFEGVEKETLAEQGLEVGTKAPDFEVQDFDGNTVKLSDFAGKYLVLVFWATTGEEPKMLVSSLRDVADYFEAAEDVQLFGIAAQRSAADVPEYLKTEELTFFRTGQTRDARLVQSYKAMRLPITYIIDPGGTIIGVFPNYSSKKVGEIMAFLDEHGIGQTSEARVTEEAEGDEEEKPDHDPQATKVLEGVCEGLKAAQALKYTSESVYTWGGEQPGQQARKVSAILKKPNLVRADVEVDSVRLGQVVSDGTNLWDYYADRNEYLRMPAPPDLSVPVESRLLPFVSNLFFHENPLDAMLSSVDRASLGEPAVTPAGQECDVVVEDFGPRGTYRIFVDKTTHLVVRVEGEIRATGPGSSDIKVVEVRTSELDPSLGADAFQFVPPEGAKEAEVVPAPKILDEETGNGDAGEQEEGQ